jgi:tetratricopeptide (TPR) repeat protein
MTPKITTSVAPLFALALLTACGARPVKPAAPPTHVEMEGMVVEHDTSQPKAALVAFDAQQLFEEGQSASQRQDFEACDTHYGKLLERFPTSRYAHSTLYNRGLCLEQMRQHGRARVHFRRYAQLATEPKDRLDGEFRYGFNLVESGDFPTARALYDRLLREAELQPQDKAECHLRRGIALMRLLHHGRADRDLKTAAAYIKEAYGDHLRGNELLAETYFRRGELYQRLSHDVLLKLPLAKMQTDLKAKARLFRKSQDGYIDAVNVQNSYWATASGMKLGGLYEQFYLDVLQAELPDDFDQDTRRFYLVALKKQLQPVLEQSLVIYEKNITMSQRIGADNEWVAETEKRLVKLRQLIEDNARAATEEKVDTPAKKESRPLPKTTPKRPKGQG